MDKIFWATYIVAIVIIFLNIIVGSFWKSYNKMSWEVFVNGGLILFALLCLYSMLKIWG